MVIFEAREGQASLKIYKQPNGYRLVYHYPNSTQTEIHQSLYDVLAKIEAFSPRAGTLFALQWGLDEHDYNPDADADSDAD